MDSAMSKKPIENGNGQAAPRSGLMWFAVSAPILGVLLYGLIDLIAAWILVPIELTGVERLVIGLASLGQFALIGCALGLATVVMLALPGTRRGIFDPRALLTMVLFSFLFVTATADLLDGAWISAQPSAVYVKWGLRVGGPIGIGVAVLLLRGIVIRVWTGAWNRAIAAGLGLICGAFGGALTYLHLTFHVGKYPGVHLLLVVGAMASGVSTIFCLLSVSGGGFGLRKRWAPLLLAVALMGTAVIVKRQVSYHDTLRPCSEFCSPGLEPLRSLLAPALSIVEPTVAHRRDSVDDLSLAVDAFERQDLSVRLDDLLTNRSKLHVLLVAMDTIRADRVGHLGYDANPSTPVLDELAQTAYVFENAYSPYPASMYSYDSIFTGLHPRSTPLFGHRNQRASKSRESLDYVKFFSDRGYFTLGLAHANVQQFFGVGEGSFQSYNWNDGRPRKMTAEQATEKFAKRIRGLAGRPLFGFVHFMEPHYPYVTHEGFGFGSSESDRYDSEIAYTDDQLGRLVATLKERGHWDRTILVVFSDHGEALGEHGHTRHDGGLYEDQVHVPLLIRLPTGPAGEPRRVSVPVSLTDIIPTVVQVLGVDDPTERQGRSLLPYMFDPLHAPDRCAYSHKYEPSFGPLEVEHRAVVFRGHKLIEKRREPSTEYLLFDLRRDPGELRNLFGRAEAKDIQAVLLGWLDRLDAETTREGAGETDHTPR